MAQTSLNTASSSALQAASDALIDAVCVRARLRDGRVIDALRRLGIAAAFELSGFGGRAAGGPAAAPVPVGAAAAIVAAAELPTDARVLLVGLDVPLVTELVFATAAEVFVIDLDPSRLTQFRTSRAVDAAHLRVGDGVDGWAEHAPFDAIIAPAPGYAIGAALRDQLRVDGAVVTLGGATRMAQTIIAVRNARGIEWREEVVCTLAMCALFGELAALIGATTFGQAQAAATAQSGRTGEALVHQGAIDEQEVVRILALQRGLSISTVDNLLTRADFDTVSFLPRSYVEAQQIVPLALRDGVLLAATADPSADAGELRRALRANRVDLTLVSRTDFQRILAAIDLGGVGATGVERERDARSEDAATLEVSEASEEPRLLQILETLLLAAIGERASDIHLERYNDRVRVRIRVDGDLIDLTHVRLSPVDLVGVINVIKINSGLDISERRRPQGGRMRRRHGDRLFDMRVQTQPSLHGEHIVIRLLANTVGQIPVESLGFSATVATAYRRLLDVPAGLVLVVGPTGSGKSTTLYSGLQILADDQTRKVITIEDPIEYSITGVQQTQVHPEVGFNFADGMRSFVRQDPDVIFVGEIRDAETGLEALRASQTGHLVLSTLHCNDAVDSVQRLRDLGLNSNSISAELLAVIAQRLARRICAGCIEEAVPDPALLAEVFPAGAPDGFRCYAGRGCVRCSGRGTRGRVAVAEFLRTGHAFRRAVAREVSLDELREVALQGGLVTMRDSALELVRDGQIAFGELRGLLLPERLAPERVDLTPPIP